MSLYNKYRPQKFNEVVGNGNIISYLEEVVNNEERPHVYLFHGPTGCGKTTLARILAKEIGCKGLNLIEVNSANFRGIDSVREMIKSSKYHGIEGGDRVWIMDEIHKMTTDAQNALLKLLEDTPPHCYYILCTTEPDKLLKTVRGRTIELQVNPLTDRQMAGLLHRIVKAEKGKKAENKLKKVVYHQIIQDSFGLPRNAIQVLEKVLSVGEEQQLKMAEQSATQFNTSIELCRALLDNSGWKKVRGILSGLKDQDAEGIRRHVLSYAQSVLLGSENNKAAHIIEEFWEPLFNIGFPGLVYACYSVIKN